MVISFKEYQVFNATTYTSLLWFRKLSEKIKYLGLSRNLNTNIELEDFLGSIKEKDFTVFNNDSLSDGPWSFGDEDVLRVLKKIKQQPYTVKDVFKKIFQGLKTGYDDIYILDNCRVLDDYIMIGYSKAVNKEIQIETKLIRPLLKGNNIHKYETLNPNKVIIFPYYRFIENGIEKIKLYTESEIISLFPKGYNYLKKFENKFREREHGRFNIDQKWFQYSRNQGISNVEKEKIILSEVSLGSNMTIDNKGIYHVGQYSMIKRATFKESYRYYLAILNSNLMWFFIQKTGSILRGGYFAYRPAYINPFPLPKNDNQNSVKEIELLVDQILAITKSSDYLENPTKKEEVKEYERQIDQLVYKLYDLTPEEIKVIENKEVSNYGI